MMYYLGLDWGTKKIGVALADDETKIAFAHATLLCDGLFLKKLQEIVDEYGVSKIILGTTTHTEHNDNSDKTAQFRDMIEHKCDVDVLLADEMFSTKMAQDNRKTANKKDIDADDSEAARIILQSWLDLH